jgi:hypothetical protein
MKHTVALLFIITASIKCQEKRALPPSTQEVKQARIAAVIAMQKKQKHDYYDYQQFFEQAPHSQPKDAEVPRYTEF